MTTEAFGLPVKGDVTHYAGPFTEQWPIERLQPALQAMLDDKEVAKFGWIQYTPYFNDGDACVFHTTVVFAIKGQQDAEIELGDDPYDHEITSYQDSSIPEHHIAFAKAIQSGHYDNALEEMFGDPATVTVSRDGIDIEYYEHD